MSKPLPEAYFRLAEVRDRIAEPHQWCRYMYGGTEHGQMCLSQAAYEAAPYNSQVLCLLFAGIARVDRTRGYGSLESFNDNNNHQTVLAAVDRAMQLSVERAL